LKQAVLALMVSQDGGVPLASKSWDGNASDTKIFHDRAAALLTTFQGSPTPRSLIADSKLYSEDHAAQLKHLGFITRIPGTLTLVAQVISQALRWAPWHPVDDATRYQRLDLGHYGMAQRWLIVSSEAAVQRAEHRVHQAQNRALATIEKQLFPLQATRFETQESAQAALRTLAGAWRYHAVAATELTEHKRYGGKGRPRAQTAVQVTLWQMRAEVCPDAEAIHRDKQQKGCFVLGTNIAASDLSDAEVITAYKAQSQVEGGFRFLKDPLFFVSSLFVKKPSRIQGLLLVMTLALLIYSVAQRRLRQA
jgi:transposase